MRNGNNGILVTAIEAAVFLHVPQGTIRRWASEDRLDRFGGPRSRHWRLEDLIAAADRRADTRRVDKALTSTEDTNLIVDDVSQLDTSLA